MLTHIDEKTNFPAMVNVTQKIVTPRVAKARSLVQLPEALRPYFNKHELMLKKGPVFQTAIIAGTMAAKKTHELIPLCHQIPIEGCRVRITIDDELLVTVECEVRTTFKTGVEMEALVGASTVALTIYDMCKAVSHEIVIKETKLIAKAGGKRFVRERPLFGLVLTGGRSKRMKSDKALIDFNGQPHAAYIYETLKPFCQEVYLSARTGQWNGTSLEHYPSIEDSVETEGPIAGLLSAFDRYPDADWFVVACDLVHFNSKAAEILLSNFQSDAVATTFTNRDRGFPEPLCAIYAPSARQVFRDAVMNDLTCPVKVLRNANVHAIEQTDGVDLANINTPEELREVRNEVG